MANSAETLVRYYQKWSIGFASFRNKFLPKFIHFSDIFFSLNISTPSAYVFISFLINDKIA